jgi:hypothetical protein
MEVIFEEITDWNPEHSRGRSESKNQIENGKINNDLSDRQSRAVTLAADTGGLIYHFAQFNDLGKNSRREPEILSESSFERS